MFQGFKQFMLRGNVLDLAVAVVMGAAFGAVVTALVKDLITPLIAAIIGKPDFSAIEFTVNGSKFLIGDFINAVVSFLLIGAARPPRSARTCKASPWGCHCPAEREEPKQASRTRACRDGAAGSLAPGQRPT
jgi:hypothetical protein